MRTLGIIALTVVLLIGGVIGWYKISYPTYTYRYRMTVEVMVDGTVRAGSSVIEIRIDKQPPVGSAPPEVSRVYGEAVLVDLGKGRNIIALLATGTKGEDVDYPYHVVPRLFALTYDDRDLSKLSTLQGRREVPVASMPTFVTFSNLNDHKTVRLIGLGEFEQVFGPGARVTRVLVEMTSEPVTRGIEKRLPWLPHPRYLSGNFSCAHSEPHCLHGAHFLRNN